MNEPLPALTLQELPEMRRKTEAVSQLLRTQIAGHLQTLRPVFTPERIYGKLASGKVEMEGADRAVEELAQTMKPFANRPYEVPVPFETHWLSLIGSALDIDPWQYVHEIQGKPITISAPVRWTLSFRGNYTVEQVKHVLAGKEAPRPDYLRQFVVNALVLQQVLARNRSIFQLFEDLRYQLKIETDAAFGGLPIVTINSCLTSIRPADELITAATTFSGVPAFIELVSLDDVAQPKDILREKLEGVLRS